MTYQAIEVSTRISAYNGAISAKRGLLWRRAMSFAVVTSFLVLGCMGCKPKQPEFIGIKYLGGPADVLRFVRREWIQQGRPQHFEPAKIVTGSFSDVFFYTNIVQVDGKAYQCRFGLDRGIFPAGLLVISDDETILWIRHRDGKVIVDPEKKSLEP